MLRVLVEPDSRVLQLDRLLHDSMLLSHENSFSDPRLRRGIRDVSRTTFVGTGLTGL